MKIEHKLNPYSICEISDEIEGWASDELDNCWHYEDDSFDYQYGSESGVYHAGHMEFYAPKPLEIKIRGEFPFYSDCLDIEVLASTLIYNLDLEEIQFDGVKVVGKLVKNPQDYSLIINLVEA